MPVGHGNYYGYKPGCCRVCGGCTDPWKCQEMKCHICSWYEFDQYTSKGRCTYEFQPQTQIEKLKDMLMRARKSFSELPPKSLEYYLNLSRKNIDWSESATFLKKHKERRLIKKRVKRNY